MSSIKENPIFSSLLHEHSSKAKEETIKRKI